jgi:hypothetical protein
MKRTLKGAKRKNFGFYKCKLIIHSSIPNNSTSTSHLLFSGFYNHLELRLTRSVLHDHGFVKWATNSA